MAERAFETRIEDTGSLLVGPFRSPRQMLAAQEYDSHASIHDDATAQKLGFKGGTIEGPTHFSQIAPLCVALWGERFLASGCISAHYRNAAFEGEQVRATVAKTAPGAAETTIRMEKEDGTEVLRGTASIAPSAAPTALDRRLAELPPPGALVILHDIRVGMKTARRTVKMGFDQVMGALYPFSLEQKLRLITEPSPWYRPDSAASSPWGRAIIPFEMISVLLNYSSKEDPLPVRGPAVGLFADQEIRLIDGPLFIGESYEIEREVMALSGSRRTESMWVLTRVFRPGSEAVVATMLINSATLKDSYGNYAAELAGIEGKRA